MDTTDLKCESPEGADRDSVVGLVVAAGLPTDGMAEVFPGAFVVVRAGAELAAVAGLETHGNVGLLRSVAVAASHRGLGLGKVVIQDRLQAAHERGLEAVYLLTTTAADYFRRLGFDDASRDDAPDKLQRSSEFATICPASAVCLVLKLR